MNDLAERLEEHAKWLEEAGESKVRAHVSPDTCKQAAETIREAIKSIQDQTTATAFPRATQWYPTEPGKGTHIEYIPPHHLSLRTHLVVFNRANGFLLGEDKPDQ